MASDNFYNHLAPFYHLIYGDWNAAIHRQGEQLTSIIKTHWGEKVGNILDVSCGIGTQAIALAIQGYQVTASDLSVGEIERAKQESLQRNLSINFSVCDMRCAYQHHQREFDVVISADNSIPHLLSDEEILIALQQMYSSTRVGGGCLITIRDYDKEARGVGIVKPYGVRNEAGKRYIIWQVWDFVGDIYDFAMYFISETPGAETGDTKIMRSRYYAISPQRLMGLMEDAGYSCITRLDNQFFQPVLIGTKQG